MSLASHSHETCASRRARALLSAARSPRGYESRLACGMRLWLRWCERSPGIAVRLRIQLLLAAYPLPHFPYLIELPASPRGRSSLRSSADLVGRR